MSNEQKMREAIKRLLKAHRITVQAPPKTITEAENQLREIENAVKYAEEALATTAPAVNQQLTTGPVDEREAFEKWVTKNGEWPNNALRSCLDPDRYANFDIQGLWGAWQAGVAMAQGVKG